MALPRRPPRITEVHDFAHSKELWKISAERSIYICAAGTVAYSAVFAGLCYVDGKRGIDIPVMRKYPVVYVSVSSPIFISSNQPRLVLLLFVPAVFDSFLSADRGTRGRFSDPPDAPRHDCAAPSARFG